ncbi:MAG: cupin domain-containing protein [Bacteroidales bacterium]
MEKNENRAPFTHISVGDLSAFKGKKFMKDLVNSSSCEISFGSLEPQASSPFFHCHKQNEENYIILSGTGIFDAGVDRFQVESGSVIRVATSTERSLKCTSDVPLIYICIQAKENSLQQATLTDGIITKT